MAGHTPDHEGDPAHIAVELDDVCGTEIRRNQNGVVAAAPRAGSGAAGRETRCPPRETPDIRGPRRELRVTEHVQLYRGSLHLNANRARRSEATGEHRALDGVAEHRVLGHHHSGVEDVCLRGPAVSPKRRRQLLELPRRLRQRVEGLGSCSRTRAVVEDDSVDPTAGVESPNPSERCPR